MEIKDIKTNLTLATVLHYYGLKTDKNNRLKCPFHDDKTPSFQAYYKTQTAYCFSSNCKTHGNSIDGVAPSKKNHPSRALSWRNWGTSIEDPAFGAIATKKRKGGGHVGFVAGETSSGRIILLGGNQNNSVNYTSYSKEILKFNYPSDYTPNYTLPKMEVKKGKVTEQ